jgi:hypothetical protein
VQAKKAKAVKAGEEQKPPAFMIGLAGYVAAEAAGREALDMSRDPDRKDRAPLPEQTQTSP